MDNFELFETIRNEIAKNKIKHVQMLMVVYQGKFAVHFTGLDNETFKSKVKTIADKYSLKLVKQGKSTETYIF